uniref:Uncharacterized protein n=1 Tax=Rangifer tarandus platyrhynchus TaxID=3082113 RepID=A0ACB0E3L5_RANTA|nr:unnamed protein product [Rangifer tarandus platyrhynchus]
MSKQAEVLSKQKWQTEGMLHSMRRQVDALGELVSSTSVDSTSSATPSQLESSLAEDSRLGPSQSSFHQVLQGPSQSVDSYRH